MKIVDSLLQGNVRALAKAITAVENGLPEAEEILTALFPYTGKAHVIGVTGSPGAGKSSMVDCMIAYYRKLGKTVGVVAVDPTSPFTGGALLGDRIRMQEHFLDDDVFIRSMGSRGGLGGLSQGAKNAVRLLDAFGKDIVIVETVGVGQSEVEIMNVAQTTLVVLTPNAGDTIQVLKAGVMEIADIFVINKSDLDGAHTVKIEVEAFLHLKEKLKDKDEWDIPVMPVVSIKNQGIDSLCTSIEKHKAHLFSTDKWLEEQKLRLSREVQDMAALKIREHIFNELKNNAQWEQLLDKLYSKSLGPYEVVDYILDNFFNSVYDNRYK
ncbi:methylmalonyl Co-A mutase-associated GTPase MeaB [Desulfitibacter alkalitolerans]|uniref:methylmalonyl Co-A mutase-associated GTPase MeaB n=1 Tax=Desulfitibacter alkalitolerans TaxID=264641 RepID=UPI000488C45E|nr:methylmalonyl Co-A mutase-associated GTPase MeaB [Desulfitibacter alkalitolerans]